MFKHTIILMTILLLTACANKQQSELRESYEANKVYNKRLKQTEKIQLYSENATKAMLTATYLYERNDDKNDTRDEVFIVGVHLDDEVAQTIQEGEYSLLLDGKAAKKAEILQAYDERLKQSSFVTEWGSYYLVTFAHTPNNSVTLTFKSQLYGEGTLHFAKVAKYVLSKEAF